METIIKKEGPQNPSKSKPVCNYQCPQESIVKKLFKYKSENPWYQKAADFFVIVYLTGGMDPFDLLTLTGKNWNRDGDEITIVPQNTKDSIIRIVVTDELSTRIMKYSNENITPDEYIFSSIKVGLNEHDRSKEIRPFVAIINKYLGKIAEELNMEKFSCYDAKRTWIIK